MGLLLGVGSRRRLGKLYGFNLIRMINLNPMILGAVIRVLGLGIMFMDVLVC